jgi:hypothetical protein
MSASLPKNGYLNDLFSVFKRRQHPFILVEESAFRWMGLRVSRIEVSITSLLVRQTPVNHLMFTILGSRRACQILGHKLYQRRSSSHMALRTRRPEPQKRFSDVYTLQVPRLQELDQARFRIQHPNHSVLGNRPRYHLGNFICYLHLEKPMQRKRLLQELADRNRKEMVVLLDKFKRKPLATLASLQGN